MICETHELGALRGYRYVVVLSEYRGQILLSRHRERTTWETQGGHIEPGEMPEQAARRELVEESGATDFDIQPLCDYWAGDPQTHKGASGVVFTARIRALGPLPDSEMAETRAFDALPPNLTYPAITPVLFARRDARRTRILIGTTNPAKIAFFRDMLDGLHASIVTPHELGITGDPQETGATPEENARIKAAYYGQYADYALCADSGLFFDALPLGDPRQPGLHVRTPNGVRLDDEQMIEYYAARSRELGGRTLAYYLDGIAIKTPRGVWGFQSTREEALDWAFYLLDTPCKARREGWPLDSISVGLDGVGFLDPSRAAREIPRGYWPRLKGFLREKLGVDA